MYSLWNWFETPLCSKTNINCWRTDDTAQTAFLWKSRNNYFSFHKMNHWDVNLSKIFSGWTRNLRLASVFSRGDICDSHFLWADSSCFSYIQLYQQFSDGFLILIINVEHSCLEVCCLFWEMLERMNKCLSFGNWKLECMPSQGAQMRKCNDEIKHCSLWPAKATFSYCYMWKRVCYQELVSSSLNCWTF